MNGGGKFLHAQVVRVASRAIGARRRTSGEIKNISFTRVTQWACKPGVSPDAGPIRLRPHGTSLAFALPAAKFRAGSMTTYVLSLTWAPQSRA